MVFMGMRENNPLEPFLLFHEVADVRDHQIDSQEFRAGKHQAAIDGDGRFAMLQQHHV